MNWIKLKLKALNCQFIVFVTYRSFVHIISFLMSVVILCKFVHTKQRCRNETMN